MTVPPADAVAVLSPNETNKAVHPLPSQVARTAHLGLRHDDTAQSVYREVVSVALDGGFRWP